MPEIAIKDIENKDAGTLQLSDEHFAMSGMESLMHTAVVNILANRRQGTHSTLGRSEVRGGGRKPYRQKGTGRARAGSNTSPLWRGGGTVFGPKPRDYSYHIPKKARRKALFAAVSAKLADGELTVVDGLQFETPKTKRMLDVLTALGMTGGSVLIVMKEMQDAVALSARNIPAVNVQLAIDLNAYDVLSHRKVLVTKDAMDVLVDRAESLPPQSMAEQEDNG